MSESANIREIRQQLDELRDPGEHDGPGHALFLALRKSYLEELEMLGAPLQPEELRRPVLRLAPAKPGHATKPPIPATKPPVRETEQVVPQPEMPMPSSTTAVPAPHPGAHAQVQRLLVKLGQTKADGGQSRIRHEIRTLCKRNGLEVPTDAVRRTSGRRTPIKQDAPPPQQLPDPSAPEAAMPAEAPKQEGVVDAMAACLNRLGGARPDTVFVPLGSEKALPEAVAKLRALRVQALEVLPLCEGLSREDGYAVRHQIDLLADVLAMGDRLAREAS